MKRIWGEPLGRERRMKVFPFGNYAMLVVLKFLSFATTEHPKPAVNFHVRVQWRCQHTTCAMPSDCLLQRTSCRMETPSKVCPLRRRASGGVSSRSIRTEVRPAHRLNMSGNQPSVGHPTHGRWKGSAVRSPCGGSGPASVARQRAPPPPIHPGRVVHTWGRIPESHRKICFYP